MQGHRLVGHSYKKVFWQVRDRLASPCSTWAGTSTMATNSTSQTPVATTAAGRLHASETTVLSVYCPPSHPCLFPPTSLSLSLPSPSPSLFYLLLSLFSLPPLLRLLSRPPPSLSLPLLLHLRTVSFFMTVCWLGQSLRYEYFDLGSYSLLKQ